MHDPLLKLIAVKFGRPVGYQTLLGCLAGVLIPQGLGGVTDG